jgi:8-oxo-dGTP pyrophosphatase MutT (NUDIX family)
MDYYVFARKVTLDDLKKFKYPNQKIGVIVHIENKKHEILLQQRGLKSRDENGLYEDIGGKFESSDKDFRFSIIRELKEEAGDKTNIDISYPKGIYHCFKNNINWLFIIFLGDYIDGDIKIMEPDKCIGYKFFKYADLIKSDLVTPSCKFLTKNIRKRIRLDVYRYKILKFQLAFEDYGDDTGDTPKLLLEIYAEIKKFNNQLNGIKIDDAIKESKIILNKFGNLLDLVGREKFIFYKDGDINYIWTNH